ncbi:flagellar hook assembly protein FlgD [Bacteroidota bacterium]
MDNPEFAAQLERLYSLEQFVSPASLLEDEKQANRLFSAAMSNSAIPGLIGKIVKAFSNKIYFDGATAVNICYNIKSIPVSADIIIANKKGDIVKSYNLTETGLNSGNHSLKWAGEDMKGNVQPKGEYTIVVTAKDSNNSAVSVDTFLDGKIQLMLFRKEGVFFKVNGVDVPFDSVFEFSASDVGFA